jgi:cell division protein ZapA (FtsZ GTPase activity inhibitor)
MPSIEFSVGNQKYLVKSDESEEHLREVAELVRRKVESLRKKNQNISLQKAAMLAAFDFASTAIKGKKKSVESRSLLLSRAEAALELIQEELNDRPNSPAI